MNLITIANDGQKITSTNYWQTPHAERGLLYLSANAGALRLLVPRAAMTYLAEMKTGRSVTIGPSAEAPGCVDLVFEDGSGAPFCVSLDKRQVERALGPGFLVPFFVWTEDGCQQRLTANVIAGFGRDQ